MIMTRRLRVPYRLQFAQARHPTELRKDQRHQMVPGRETLTVPVAFVAFDNRCKSAARHRFHQTAEHRILVAHAKLSILSLVNQKDTAEPRRRLACSYYQSIIPRTALRFRGNDE